MYLRGKYIFRFSAHFRVKQNGSSRSRQHEAQAAKEGRKEEGRKEAQAGAQVHGRVQKSGRGRHYEDIRLGEQPF